MTVNTRPTKGDRLEAPHDQSANLTYKNALVLVAFRIFIKLLAGGFYVDPAIVLVQGVMQ